MKRKFKILLYLYFLAIIIVGYFVFPFWAILLLAWSLLSIFTIEKHTKESTRSRKIFLLITIILYPLLATAIKYMITRDIIAYSWFWLNRTEHLIWSLATSILVTHITEPEEKQPIATRLLFVVAIVSLFGNLNEIVEFIARRVIFKTAQGSYAIIYVDTIHDMTMNLVGSFIGTILTLLNKPLKRRG